MPRLPIPNSDENIWGGLLNEFLRVSHREDGTLQHVFPVVNVSDFGAVGDGVTDDTGAIQSAIDYANGKTVTFEPGLFYKTTGTLTITQHNTIIEGNNALIDYYGSGNAIEVGPLANDFFIASCRISELAVRLNSGQLAWNIKASHCFFNKISAFLRQNGQTCYQIWGDGLHGSGSYYNIFTGCNAQGNVHEGSIDQTGWYFTYDPPTPSRAPNANRWFGGRTGQCTLGYRINGGNNVFYSPIAEGNTDKVFWFDNPDSPVGCFENHIYSPYVEGALGTNVAVVGSNSINTVVEHPLITSIGPGAILIDEGVGTLFTLANKTIQVPAFGHTLTMRNAAESPQVAGPFAGYTFTDPDNNSSVTVRNASQSSQGATYFEVINGNNVVLLAAGTNTTQVKAPNLLLNDGAVGIYTGSGLPTTAVPDGSLFLRTDGDPGSTLYVREAGTWVAK